VHSNATAGVHGAIVTVEDADAMMDASAMEEDLAMVMKKLPASLRYGARDGGRDIIATGMVQQLYTRLMRLQVSCSQN
jgi:hypothetical protein